MRSSEGILLLLLFKIVRVQGLLNISTLHHAIYSSRCKCSFFLSSDEPGTTLVGARQPRQHKTDDCWTEAASIRLHFMLSLSPTEQRSQQHHPAKSVEKPSAI